MTASGTSPVDRSRPAPVTVLETERLTLMRLGVNDAEFILELLNDPAFLTFVGDKRVRTPDDAREYISTGPLESYKQYGFGLYLVRLIDDDTPIGICGLVKRDALEHADIGYALLPAFRARGYALEAAAAVLDQATTTLGLSRVLAVTSPNNDASIRILEKLGMKFEKMISLSDDQQEVMLYASGA